jgi:CHAD domain-containing protein
MAKDGTFQWDDSASAADNARRKLPDLMRAYYGQGRKLAGGDLSPELLHEFRLATKRLRYTVEMFRACYGPGLDNWLTALREIQDHLGAINDCVATKELLAAKLEKGAPERIKIERSLGARIRREAAAFRHYWQGTFDTPGEARRWTAYFSRGPEHAAK